MQRNINIIYLVIYSLSYKSKHNVYLIKYWHHNTGTESFKEHGEKTVSIQGLKLK